MAWKIMIQGTMSNAGKSLLCAGLCRIFKQDGYKVAPFKSQNMALNSFITDKGLEMGRAQVVQAEAAGIEPEVSMNPILLKPTNDVGSQVIVNGEVLGNMSARDYFKYKNVPLVDGKSKLAISRCVGIGCSQIITKSVKDKMIPFKKNFIAHDWLAAFIANEGKGISYIEEPLFDYRLHSTNVFGGRSLSQNLNRWKQENGNDYKSFLEYRKDAIDRAYLGGIEMCKEYVHIKSDKEFIEEAEKYYNCILESKKVNLKLGGFFKILAGKNQGKKMIREIVLFHFPVLGYLKFLR